MKRKLFVLSLSLAALVSCGASVETNSIKLGDDTFCIPERYSTLDQTTGPMLNIAGTDADNYGGSFQVAIDPAEVKETIPTYFLTHGDLAASFFINIRPLPSEQLGNALNKQYHADALQLANDYEKAQVEHDINNNFYRVSTWEAPPPFVLWDVLTVKPSTSAVIPEHLKDYYLASCSRAGGTTGINGTSSSCDYSIGVDGHLVKIITTENNLLLKEKITSYAQSLLEVWRDNCE
jgi:hypothetical protein